MLCVCKQILFFAGIVQCIEQIQNAVVQADIAGRYGPEKLRGIINKLSVGYNATAFVERGEHVFQPHLYTRTRDFHRGFAQALSLADEVLLVPIYPAREEPIEGVSSDMIAELLTVPHRTVPLEHIAFETEKARPDILITFGAGNIENYTGEIARRLRERPKK